MDDKLDFGEFGMLSPEEALKQMQSMKKDYTSLQGEFTKRSQALSEYKEAADVVEMIRDLGLGDQVAQMIMGAQQGVGAPPQYAQQPAYQEDYGIPNDPYVMQLVSEVEELKGKLSNYEGMYLGDRVQREISDFRSAHSNITDEELNEIGQYMVDNHFPSLESAYRVYKFDDLQQAARLDGEKRVREQLAVNRGEGDEKQPPILGGGEGGLQADEGKPPPKDWNAALSAALDDWHSQETEE